jgi:hypothetical protein
MRKRNSFSREAACFNYSKEFSSYYPFHGEDLIYTVTKHLTCKISIDIELIGVCSRNRSEI